MELNLIRDDRVVITHILQQNKIPESPFSESLASLRRKAWGFSESIYNLLSGRIIPDSLNSLDNENISQYFLNISKTDEYKKVAGEVDDYIHKCEKEWESNYDFTSNYLQKLTGIDFKDKKSVGYITHPGLACGRHLDEGSFMFGHKGSFENYATIYFWHEILHDYFGKSDIDHALIEFLTDEEMRAQLNKIEYPAYAGHDYLEETKDKMLDFWREFLSSTNWKNIFEFRDYLFSQLL